jgi:deoxyribodipyrimidine photo-lyase
LYTRDQFALAQTHDDLERHAALNAHARKNSRLHRDWGKKIIEWSLTTQDALDTMLYIHDRYALDGRDPNTYTNCLWCFDCTTGLGERKIFGMVRYCR